MSETNKNDHVVIAFFNNMAAATAASDVLKAWDKSSEDVKLGAIGVLAKEGGAVKMHVPHKAGKGAKVGAVLGIIAGVLSGGVTLIGGAIVGALGGGAIGAFMKKSVGMTKDDIERLGAQLKEGGAALVVVCDDYEVTGTEAQLTGAGGQVQKFAVSAEAMDEAQQAVAVKEAEAKVDDAVSDVKATAKDAAGDAKEAVDDAAATAKDAAKTAADAVKDAGDITKEAVSDAATTVKGAAKTAADAADAAGDAAKDVADAAKGVASEAADAVQDVTKKA